MEKNHYKITEHRRKYNTRYLCYFLAYAVVIALALILNAPLLILPMLILIIIHILTRCVDVAEMDDLLNEELFDDLKHRYDE